MLSFIAYFDHLLHLFYPHLCLGCGSDLYKKKEWLCISCLHHLPHTQFQHIPNNPSEKIFTGRLSLYAAHSEFYFSKGQVVQRLIHQLKYKRQKDLGIFLGELMGISLKNSDRFSNIEAIVPLPIHKKKQKERGYNQSFLLAKGISNITQWPVLENVIIRKSHTTSQTHQQRFQRWQNTYGDFEVMNKASLIKKNILLVDDVITTGATLEACGRLLSPIDGLKLYIASLAIATQ